LDTPDDIAVFSCMPVVRRTYVPGLMGTKCFKGEREKKKKRRERRSWKKRGPIRRGHTCGDTSMPLNTAISSGGWSPHRPPTPLSPPQTAHNLPISLIDITPSQSKEKKKEKKKRERNQTNREAPGLASRGPNSTRRPSLEAREKIWPARPRPRTSHPRRRIRLVRPPESHAPSRTLQSPYSFSTNDNETRLFLPGGKRGREEERGGKGGEGVPSLGRVE